MSNQIASMFNCIGDFGPLDRSGISRFESEEGLAGRPGDVGEITKATDETSRAMMMRRRRAGAVGRRRTDMAFGETAALADMRRGERRAERP